MRQSLFDGVLDGGSKTNSVDFSTKGRSQFIQQLEEFIAETEKAELLEPSANPTDEMMISPNNLPESDAIDVLSEMEENLPLIEPEIPEKNEGKKLQEEKAQEIEQVMNNGMQFLSGLFKMSTGIAGS